mgnify:CR=1 FL=1
MNQPTTIELVMQRINEHIKVEDDMVAATEETNPVVADKRIVGKVNAFGQENGRANNHGRDLGSSVLEDVSKKAEEKGHKTRRI